MFSRSRDFQREADAGTPFDRRRPFPSSIMMRDVRPFSCLDSRNIEHCRLGYDQPSGEHIGASIVGNAAEQSREDETVVVEVLTGKPALRLIYPEPAPTLLWVRNHKDREVIRLHDLRKRGLINIGVGRTIELGARLPSKSCD
jgi:hypothetical protein